MPTKRRISLSTEGWYYLFVSTFIAIGAVLRQVNLLVIIAGLLIGLLMFNWRLVVATLRRLEVIRRLPELVSAGESFLVDLRLTNHRRWLNSWAIVVNDSITQQRSDGKTNRIKAEVMFPYVEAGTSKHGAYRCSLTRRGQYQFGPARITTRFPFGLIRATTTTELSDIMTVYPRLGRLTSKWKHTLGVDRAGEQQSQRRLNSGVGDLYGMREWRSGDSRSWIHWRSSAKQNELVVRQFDRPRGCDVTLIVDLWQRDDANDVELENVERALSFASTAVIDLCQRKGSKLIVIMAGAQVEKRMATVSAAFARLNLEKFAIAEAGNSGEFAEILADVTGEAPLDSRTIIISTRPSESGNLEIYKEGAGAPKSAIASERSHWIDVSRSEWTDWFQAGNQEPIDSEDRRDTFSDRQTPLGVSL